MKSFSTISYLLRQGQSFSGLERNCCFLNTGGTRFATFSSLSGFDFIHDARAVALVDWDYDGDLDLWLSNRTAPRAQFLRNDLEGGNHFLALRPRGTTCNRDAIGARLELWRPGGDKPSQIRTLYAGEGFLGQSSPWITFGLGTDPSVDRVVVRWPGGGAEEFRGLAADGFYSLTQDSGQPEPWSPPKPSGELDATPPVPLAITEAARIVPISRLPMPNVEYQGLDGTLHHLADWRGGPVLLNLWATWCKPCMAELSGFAKEAGRLEEKGLKVLALNVDELNEDPHSDLSRSREILSSLGFSGPAGALSPTATGVLDVFHRGYFSLRRPIPTPTSFLLGPNGDLIAIYKGPVTAEQLLSDLDLVNQDAVARRTAAMPFAGRWQDTVTEGSPHANAVELMREGFTDEAADYLVVYIRDRFPSEVARMSAMQRQEIAKLAHLMADLHRLRKDSSGVTESLRLAVESQPQAKELNYDLGRVLVETGQAREGVTYLQKALAADPKDPNTLSALGIAWGTLGDLNQAVANFSRAVELDPGNAVRRQNLAFAFEQRRNYLSARDEYLKVLALDPGNPSAALRVAWILAAAPEDGARDGQKAVALAEKLVSSGRNADALESLAAAYAEAGRLPEAVRTQEEAAGVLSKSGPPRRSQIALQRLRLYQAGRPYRFSTGR